MPKYSVRSDEAEMYFSRTDTEEFQKATHSIAEAIWTKFGPEGVNSHAAHEEIKSRVKFSSWIISESYVRYFLPGKYAIDNMIEACLNRLQTIQNDNKVFYWMVKFVVQKRFLTYQEIDEIADVHCEWCGGHGVVDSGGVSEDGNPIDVACTECVPKKWPDSRSVVFRNEIETEEAAQNFCRGYMVAGMTPPKIQIVAFNSNHEEIPKAKVFIPKA